MKTIRLFALAIPALAVLAAASVQAAEPNCKDNVAQVQKEWDKMYPMGMDLPSNNYKQVTDDFRRAKELCAQGKSTEATQYLEVVRGHLHMPLILGESNSGRVPANTLHSGDAPTEHHDAKTTPAMGSTPGAAAPQTMHSDGPSTHHDPQLKK